MCVGHRIIKKDQDEKLIFHNEKRMNDHAIIYGLAFKTV